MLQRLWNFLFTGKAGFWTALFTGVLTLFTYMMYQVSKTTNETTRSSERAFLSFAGLGLGARMHDSDKWTGNEITVNWVNSGTTPARSLVFQSNAKPWPIGDDLPQSYEFPLPVQKSRGTVGPKASYSTNQFVPRETLEGGWQGKDRMFIWGTIRYKDIFEGDPDRITEFCVELTHLTTAWAQPTSQQPKPAKDVPLPLQIAPPIDNPNSMLVGFQWQACRSHNCYDEECNDYKDRIKDMQ